MSLKKKIKDWYYLKIRKMDISDYNILKMRKRGIFVGNHCRIFTDIISNEPTLISIGDNVTISSDVKLLTHDNAISKSGIGFSDLAGSISIGNNCFIGISAIIMPGVFVGNNCIVGAGSVLTKSVPDGFVVAGNPARIVCTSNEYFSKNSKYGIQFRDIRNKAEFFKNNEELLLKKSSLNK